ncbi:DoxX family protein [Weissella paramesenteroides]|uniref:DoxX family protein n=1 Tax=Weissella paramesenteroides TaxID=1249 RepID=UPI003F21347E
MNIFLWVVQVLIVIIFLMSGFQKTFQFSTKGEELKKMDHLDSELFIKFIGTAELLGAFGLILPLALNILPFLTPLAAIGLAIIMVGAAFTHGRYKEWSGVGFVSLLTILLIIIAIFRF